LKIGIIVILNIWAHMSDGLLYVLENVFNIFGFVVDKAALGQVFSEYFGFPCQSFHRFLHYHNHPGLTQ
jgi:hypothetical protein